MKSANFSSYLTFLLISCSAVAKEISAAVDYFVNDTFCLNLTIKIQPYLCNCILYGMLQVPIVWNMQRRRYSRAFIGSLIHGLITIDRLHNPRVQADGPSACTARSTLSDRHIIYCCPCSVPTTFRHTVAADCRSPGICSSMVQRRCRIEAATSAVAVEHSPQEACTEKTCLCDTAAKATMRNANVPI
jgi:hypothetical protein